MRARHSGSGSGAAPKTAPLVAALWLLATFTPQAAGAQQGLQVFPSDGAMEQAWGAQSAAAIASSDSHQLVVWADTRSNLTGTGEGETSTDIMAQLLDASGAVVGVPFPIVMDEASQLEPKVAWNGTAWLVAFETTVLGGTGYYYDQTLAVARVSADGQLLDEHPSILYGVGGSSLGWALAGTQEGWVVAYQGTSVSADIGAVRIDLNGEVLDAPDVQLVPETYYLRFNLRLAHAAGVCWLTWDENGGTWGLPFDLDLVPLEAAPRRLVDAGLVDLDSNGDQLFMLWTRSQLDGSTALIGATLSTDGQLSRELNISRSYPPQAYAPSRISWDGQYWWATWGSDNTTRAARITSGLSLVDTAGRELTGLSAGDGAGAPAGGVSLIWSALSAGGQTDVWGGAVNASVQVAGPEPISVASRSQLGVDVAWGSLGPVAVYQSLVSDSSAVMAMALGGDGAALWTSPLQLSDSTSVGSPAIEWVGDHFLVVWSSGDSVYGRRLSSDGTPLDGGPFRIMGGYGPVDLAGVGDDALVIAFQYSSNVELRYAVAARVRADKVLDAQPFYVGNNYSYATRVTELGGRWLVTTLRKISHDSPHATVQCVFVSPDGAVSAEFDAEGPGTIAGANSIFSLGLVGGQSAALLVQVKEVTSGVEGDLIGQLIYPDGTLSAVTNLTPWEGNQYRAEVAYRDGTFVVVYQDQRNRDPINQSIEQLDARSDLMGLRVLEDGTVLDPRAFALSSSSRAESHPSVGCGPDHCIALGSVLGGEGFNYQAGAAPLGMGSGSWPVVLLSATPDAGALPLNVDFTAEGSYDPVGQSLSYSWDFGDGATAQGLSTSHTFTTDGPHTVSVTATTADGQSTRNTARVNAHPQNIPPVAVASANVTSGGAPLAVVFSASGSYDPDGLVGNVEWTFGDGPAVYYGATAYHTYTKPGVYVATVKVIDSAGASSVDTLNIRVTQANLAPTAVITAAPTSGVSPLTVSFSAASSSDPEGGALTYGWNFGDGGAASGDPVAHTYNTPGTWQAVLTVTDNAGNRDTDTVTIVVEEPAPGCAGRAGAEPLSLPAGGVTLWLGLVIARLRRRGARIER